MSNPSVRHKLVRLLLTATATALLASCGGVSVYNVDVPNAVAVADLNGDGAPDIVVVSAQIDSSGLTERPGYAGVIMNSSSSPGTLSKSVHYQTSSGPPTGLAVGDVMGTGAKDLVVANNSLGTLSLLTETTPTSAKYNAAKSIPTGGQPNWVTLADMNGDGALDIVVADNLGNVLVLLQNPNNRGSFGSPIALALPTRGISVTVADLNNDGLPDIIATSFDSSGSNGEVDVFFQQPGATATSVSFDAPVSVLTGCEPNQTVVTDLTGQDPSPLSTQSLKSILVACQGLGSDGNPGLGVVQQSSPGVFDIQPTVYGPTGGYGGISLAVGDVDGDGLPDVVMTSIYPSGSGTVMIMPQVANSDGSSSGTFGADTEYYALGQPTRVQLADLNKDGLLDIVVADATTIGVLMNARTAVGDITFNAEYQAGL